MVDIQIQFDQAAKDDFNGQNKACFSNIDRWTGLFTGDLPITRLAGRLSHFNNELEILTQTSGDIVSCKGVQNSFSFNSTPCQNPKFSAHNKNTSTDNRKWNQGIVGKGGHQEGRKYLREIPEKYVFRRKKDQETI